MVSTLYIFLRNSCFGFLANGLTGHKVLAQAEHQKDYVIPEKYLSSSSVVETSSKSVDEKKDVSDADDSASGEKIGRTTTTEENVDEIVVGWEGDDDPENPYNWPLVWKVFFLVQMGFLTVSIYMGSSIYTPGFADIQEQFGVGLVVAILPLSVFVIGYGTGPLIFSPLSEHPAIGRAPIYIITLFIFVVLQIPTALAKNIGSLIVLRFLAGFFASPALATGGASVIDVIKITRMPIGLAGWALSGVCGPVLGPLIGGVIVQQVKDWRWCFWFLLIMGGAVNLVIFIMLPESSTQTLLYRKAERLRKLTGNENIVSEGHKKLAAMNRQDIILDICWRPFKICLTEPIVFFINVYIALVYAVFYTYFEAFPIILQGVFHFNNVEMGVSYVSVMIGVWIGCGLYIYSIYHRFTLKLESGTMVVPEIFLMPAIYGAAVMPIGLIIVGWSSTANSHWIAPLIGAAVFSIGGFVIFQTLFNYLAFSFKPQYLASVFASNGLFRAGFACSFPLFATQMYTHMGPDKFPVGWGCTMLALVATAMILIPVVLYKKGDKFRARSMYAN